MSERPFKRLEKQMKQLLMVEAVLQQEIPDMAPGVRAEIETRIDAALSSGLDGVMGASFFFGQSIDQIEATLAGGGSEVQARLLDRIAPDLSRLDNLPDPVLEISEAGLNRLVDLGLNYDGLLRQNAARMWLERGAAFGERAFRLHHPRKNPVFAFWEDHGFVIPRNGLCPEGEDMMVEALLMFDTRRETWAIRASFQHRATEKRLLLILLLYVTDIPYCLRERRLWERVLPRTLAKDLVKLLDPEASNHKRIARAGKLSRVLPPKDILTLSEEDFPQSLDDLLIPCAA